MEDLLLYLASSEDETQFCLHVLEIISLMFREQVTQTAHLDLYNVDIFRLSGRSSSTVCSF